MDAGPHAVWQVLTDYDDLPHFVPSIRTSVAHELAAAGRWSTRSSRGRR